MEDFSNEVMVMSYLYSKLPETGVSPHIGTGGAKPFPGRPAARFREDHRDSPIARGCHCASKINEQLYLF
jgi:hypothetical protein